jgi:hypothetical protein
VDALGKYFAWILCSIPSKARRKPGELKRLRQGRHAGRELPLENVDDPRDLV